jgi:hypothetical protein
MKAALVDSNNIVMNIIVWDESCVAPEGVTAVILPDNFLISTGWIYNNEQSFTDPNPPVAIELPPALTLQDLQAQLAELAAKIQAIS